MAPEFAPENPHLTLPVVAGGGAAGTLAGAVITNQYFPATETLAPHLKVQASLMLHESGVTASYTPNNLVVHVPHAPVKAPLGVHLNFAEVPAHTAALERTVASLASHYHAAVIDPIRDSLLERLALGSGVGLALGSWLGYKALQKVRSSSLREARLHRSRGLAWALASCLAIGGCGAEDAGLAYETSSQTDVYNLDTSLTNHIPALRDATVSGPNSTAVIKGLHSIYSELHQGKKYWNRLDGNISAAWQRFVASGQYNSLLGPNTIVGLDLSGTHCNQPYLNSVFPTLMKAIKPDFTVVAGDLYIHNHATALENGCYEKIADQTTGALITIRGNHDPNTAAPTDLNPDNHDSVTLKDNGFSFVGAPDPRSHAPDTRNTLEGVALRQAYGQEGAAVAKRACELYQQTGKRPIAVVHYKSAGFETMLRGCASVVDNAHGDDNVWEPTLEAYPGDQGVTYQQTTTTASGYTGDFGMITPAKRPGSAIIQIFDKQTHELSASVAIMYGLDEKDVIIRRQSLPRPLRHPNDQRFVDAYSPTAHGVLHYQP